MKVTKNGFGWLWTNDKEKMLEAGQVNIKKATQASIESPNRPSLHLFRCEACNRMIKGAGPAGHHKKKTGHRIERV